MIVEMGSSNAQPKGVRLTDQLNEVIGEVSRLRGYGVDVAYDLETTSTDPIHSRIITIALKPRGKRALVIDVRTFSPDDLRMLGSILEPLFDGLVTIVGHNLKFDLEFALAQMGLAGRRAYDTMLAEQIIAGRGWSSALKAGIHFGMADVAERYNLVVEKESRNWFINLDDRDAWFAPLPGPQIAYIRQDVSVTHRIKDAQEPLIDQYALHEVIDLEMRALFALVGVEVFGVQVDREGWLSVIDRVTARMQELELVLHLGTDDFDGLDIHILKVRHERYLDKWRPYQDWMIARDTFIETRRAEWDEGAKVWVAGVTPQIRGVQYKNWSEYKKASLAWWYERHGKVAKPPENKSGVNLGSWMQVRDGFNALGIPVVATSEEALSPYLHSHPLVKIYLEYGAARKLVTVYGRERGKKERAFIELLDATNRLRASYQQIGADTGRMSSFNPNFQQIPADGLGAELRRNIIAASGYRLVVADFSNIELRIAAELSGDQFLLDAFASGQDLHAYTALVMFKLKVPGGADLKEWTESHDAVVSGRTLPNKSYRKVAKTINYMLLYGAGVRRLSGMLEIAEKDAKALLAIYYDTFATVIGWLKEQKSRLDRAKKAGLSRVFAETRSGRRRWFDIPEYPSYPKGADQMISVLDALAWEEAKDQWKADMASIKRQLGNTPIQGLSADITKLAAALWYECAGYDDAMRLVAVIHDEFIIEAKDDEHTLHQASHLLETVMMQAMMTYLYKVALGEVTPVVTPYWKH